MGDTKTINLFIVGAAKAGTTALWGFLNQHPSVFLSPIKEPHFFFKDFNIELCRKEFRERVEKNKSNKHQEFYTNSNDYYALFEEAKKDQILGEASASYLYSKIAAKEISAYNSKAKILIVLRNPIERAFSHYLMNLRMGFSHAPFVEDFEQDQKSKVKAWGASHLYKELGMYFEQVSRFYNTFPKNQVLIIRQEELKANTTDQLEKITKFLDLESFKYELNIERNEAKLPRNSKLLTLVKPFRKLIPRSLTKPVKSLFYTKSNIPKLEIQDRKKLLPHFIDDIKLLEQLLDINLKHWYEF